jgi:transposase
MTQFTSSKRLCCWAGLTPGNNRTANKNKSVQISRAGVYLKPALVQVAHAAVKSTRSPYYKNKYERISKRRGTAPPLILFIPIQMRFRDPHALILILRAVREI